MYLVDNSSNLLKLNVKRLRELKHWTQAHLAEAANLSVQMIQKIEYGRTNPSTETLDDLSRALECHPSALLADVEGTPLSQFISETPNPKTSNTSNKENTNSKIFPGRAKLAQNEGLGEEARQNHDGEPRKPPKKSINDSSELVPSAHTIASEIAARVITELKSQSISSIPPKLWSAWLKASKDPWRRDVALFFLTGNPDEMTEAVPKELRKRLLNGLRFYKMMPNEKDPFPKK